MNLLSLVGSWTISPNLSGEMSLSFLGSHCSLCIVFAEWLGKVYWQVLWNAWRWFSILTFIVLHFCMKRKNVWLADWSLIDCFTRVKFVWYIFNVTSKPCTTPVKMIMVMIIEGNILIDTQYLQQLITVASHPYAKIDQYRTPGIDK